MERVQESDPHKDKKGGTRLRLVDLLGQSGKGLLRRQAMEGTL